MGVSPMMSNSSLDNPEDYLTNNILGNPNPCNYKILEFQQIDDNLVIKILYPDSNNYEGKKILVFENCNIGELKKQRVIDPHFSENNKYYSPIARFEPTKKGWGLAIYVARAI